MTPTGASSESGDEPRRSEGLVAEAEEATRASGARPSHVRVLVLAVLVAAVLVALLAYVTKSRSSSPSTGASAPTPSTTAPAGVPVGYHLNPVPTAGLSLAVRNTWLALDPTSSTFKAAVQRAVAANPAQAAILQQSGSDASTIKFFAADTNNPIYASNVQVTLLGVSKAALSDPTGLQTALRKEIPNAEVHRATIAGTPGLVMTGTLTFKLLNGTPITMHATGYYVATSAGVASIDFATTDDGARDVDVQAGINSVRLTR